MNPGWKVFLVFAALLAAALAAEQAFVPGIVPIAFADDPQPAWAVQTAFILRALELMSGAMALVGLLLMFGVVADKLRVAQARLKTDRAPTGTR